MSTNVINKDMNKNHSTSKRSTLKCIEDLTLLHQKNKFIYIQYSKIVKHHIQFPY
jgi:hypothetical protein